MVREHVNIKLRDTIERKTEHLPKTRPIRNNQEEPRKIATNKKPPGRTPKKKKEKRIRRRDEMKNGEMAFLKHYNKRSLRT